MPLSRLNPMEYSTDPSKEERKRSVYLLFESLRRGSVLSVEERKKLASVLGDCRRISYFLLPAVILHALLWVSAGELMLPGSKLSFSLLCCSFFCICAYSTSAPQIARFFTYITYVALVSFFVGRAVSSVIGMLFLYLDSLLAAFFLGIVLSQQSNSTIGNTLSLDAAAHYLWLATPSVLLLHTIIPNSDVVAGAVIWVCLTFYYIFLGSRLGREVILSLRRLGHAAFNAFLAYRLRFHAYFDPEIMTTMRYMHRLQRFRVQVGRMPPSRPRMPDDLPPFTVRGDRRSLFIFSLVLAVSVIALLCFSDSEPVLATRTFSLIIISHLFCWTLYFSTEATSLSKIFIFLSYTWLVGFLVGALLSDLCGMIIMLLDTFLAAALFGATLAQHRQIKGTETSCIVAIANTRIHKENRRPAYILIGLLAVCYAPRLVYMTIVDSPAFEVAVSLFAGITFIQIIHISCVIGWLEVIFDTSVPIFLYFGFVVWTFVISYALLGELFGLIVYWHFILASTAFLGYYSQVYACYEEILSRRALASDG